jgi:amino acid adenylation domain-containing protein
VCDLPLLDGGGRDSLLALGRGPARPYAADAMLHTLFEAQAARTPHAHAASCGGRSLTYAELNAAANRLAHRLRGMGVAPEARVALLLERSLDTAIATLAVLKAGAACVPIDPDYPAERVAYLLADSGAQAVLTHSSAGALPDAGAATIVRLDGMEAELAMESAENPRPLAGPESLAYVIYTSGSTDRPKGAMVEHGSLVCYATGMAERLGLGEGERVLQFASPGFDVVIEELFPAWVSGACVVFSRAELMDPPVLTRVLEEEGISVVELPTAFWHEWVHELARTGRALPKTLRRVLVGGERVSAERLAEWAGLGVELVHVFGLTETACTSSILELPAGDAGERWANLPIGTPLANVEMYVVDAWMSPVPAGVPGELLIGGRGVGRGYLGRPSLTAERFIPHPFGGQPGARVYRTGDRVRWLEDGTMEFLGRADHQAKIRGFRVEPAEVEAALERHPAVREACVVVSDDASGGRRLVAYLTGGAADAAPLRAHLRERLPEYMVPGAFVFLDALPLSPNGKVDRRALPAPGAVGSADAYVAPRTRAEVELAAIWAEVLGVERVGAHDHFFDLGGHSLHAMRVISRTRHTLGVELPLRALFEAPVLEAFAARVDGHAAGAESLIDALERLSDEEVRELLAEPLAPEAR